MLSKTLRIGPLFLLEVLAVVVGVMLQTAFHERCWSLAMLQSALSIFLVESLLAYHLIGRSKRHRKEHLCGLAAAPTSKLYATLAWNQIVLLTVMSLFAVATVSDFMLLLRPDQHEECLFKLYPLCLELESERSTQKQIDLVQLWILFALYTAFNVFLLALMQWKQYGFTLHILRNRRQLAVEFMGSEPLLAS